MDAMSPPAAGGAECGASLGRTAVLRGPMTDDEWAFFAPFPLESGVHGGRPPADHRRVLDAVLWVTRTGSPWRDLPGEPGKLNSVHRQYRRSTEAGVWDVILSALADREAADNTMEMIDSTIVRAHQPNRAAKSSAPVCRQTYANRNRIECFLNKIKHQYRAATRYDKLASSLLGFVQLATIRIWISSSTRPSSSPDGRRLQRMSPTAGRKSVSGVRRARSRRRSPACGSGKRRETCRRTPYRGSTD
ncbi:Transposase [Kaistia soli DSM 19436]|uniref:Transposase n=1 Tax=Kaistia soli DSM 19436 TaxID=1122133 RepID=A0A1M5NAJ0_9HYPH|nr:Transposase [Kaistia soli DSM 19436]